MGRIDINPTNEFHILRHFKSVDRSYRATLIDEPYFYYDYVSKKFVKSTITVVDIDNALKTIGTKFEENIPGIETPHKLLEIIKDKFRKLEFDTDIKWVDDLELKHTSFTFDYKVEVGQMNCIALESISSKDRKQIQQRPRSQCLGEQNILVDTITGLDVPCTKTIRVGLTQTKQLPFYFITAYPDCHLPDDVSDEIVYAV